MATGKKRSLLSQAFERLLESIGHRIAAVPFSFSARRSFSRAASGSNTRTHTAVIATAEETTPINIQPALVPHLHNSALKIWIEPKNQVR
jgi:hypothetical protein